MVEKEWCAPGGSESGEETTAQLGGRRAARRAEWWRQCISEGAGRLGERRGRRLRSSEGAGRLGERRGGDCAVMKAGEEAV